MSVNVEFHHIKDKQPPEGVGIFYIVTDKKEVLDTIGVFHEGVIVEGCTSVIEKDENGEYLEEVEIYLHNGQASSPGVMVYPWSDDMPDVYWSRVKDTICSIYKGSGKDRIDIRFLEELYKDGEVSVDMLKEAWVMTPDNKDHFWHYHVRFYTDTSDLYCFGFTSTQLESDLDVVQTGCWVEDYNERLRLMYEALEAGND